MIALIIIKGFIAFIVISLNLAKLICIKKFARRKPHTQFMINFSIMNFLVGFMLLLIHWTADCIKLVPGGDNVISNPHNIKNFGLSSMYIISFIHMIVYEAFRLKVIFKPFLRLTITKKTITKTVCTTWLLGFLAAVLYHMVICHAVGTQYVVDYENLFLAVCALTTLWILSIFYKISHMCIRGHGSISSRRSSQRKILVSRDSVISINATTIQKRRGIASLVVLYMSWTPFIVWAMLRTANVFNKYTEMNITQGVVCILPNFYFIWKPLEYIKDVVQMYRKKRSRCCRKRSDSSMSFNLDMYL